MKIAGVVESMTDKSQVVFRLDGKVNDALETIFLQLTKGDSSCRGYKFALNEDILSISPHPSPSLASMLNSFLETAEHELEKQAAAPKEEQPSIAKTLAERYRLPVM